MLSTVPTKQDIFPPESLLKKTRAKEALSEKAAIHKAATKKVCYFFYFVLARLLIVLRDDNFWDLPISFRLALLCCLSINTIFRG